MEKKIFNYEKQIANQSDLEAVQTTDYRARNQASGLVTTAFRALPITDMAWLMTLGQK